MFLNTNITYSTLTIMSTGKKSFTNMGQIIERSGDTVSRLLRPSEESFACCHKLSIQLLSSSRELYLSIDDTLLRKVYSRFMQGAGYFYDTKIGRNIMAYRPVAGLLSDGKHAVPIGADYVYPKEIVDQIEEEFPSKIDIAKALVETATRIFPKTRITVLADGLFASVEFLRWCKSMQIPVEVRMHSNRVVIYKGEKIALRQLARKIGPKGRQIARTFTVLWHDIKLEVTVVRRTNKYGEETVVFQTATYKAIPIKHVRNYEKRWPIEMVIRTSKQHLGLQDCYSCSLKKQRNHVAAILLAYGIAQSEMKLCKLRTPEDAIRRLKKQDVEGVIARIAALVQNFQSNVVAHA